MSNPLFIHSKNSTAPTPAMLLAPHFFIKPAPLLSPNAKPAPAKAAPPPKNVASFSMCVMASAIVLLIPILCNTFDAVCCEKVTPSATLSFIIKRKSITFPTVFWIVSLIPGSELANQRMAGPYGAFAIRLMNDPNAAKVTNDWMNLFDDSNDGANFLATRQSKADQEAEVSVLDAEVDGRLS